MPESVKLLIRVAGVIAVIGGSTVIGLLMGLRALMGRLARIWIWIFSICIICMGIYLICIVSYSVK